MPSVHLLAVLFPLAISLACTTNALPLRAGLDGAAAKDTWPGGGAGGKDASLAGSGGMDAPMAAGGNLGTGGFIQGGMTGTGGIESGGATGLGGRIGTGGSTVRPGTGGADAGSDGMVIASSGGTDGGGSTGGGGLAAQGGSGSGGTGGDVGTGGTSSTCSMGSPPTGGTKHSSNAEGTAGGQTWLVWANGDGASMTTYDTTAFSASWNDSGDFLARFGLQWDDTKTYDQYGAITAQFAYEKAGTGGDYSYIGIYGSFVNPCVEYYIVDDSYDKMPIKAYNASNKGTVDIDGGTYSLYMSEYGTGARCTGGSTWTRVYSVRQTARQCGQISVSEHFRAWAKAGIALGKLDQAMIFLEAGGGTGSIDFTMASVTVQ